MKEREVEFCTLRILGDSENRYVFCRRKPKNKFERFFIPWRQMWRSYYRIVGRTNFFSTDDYKKLVNEVKTTSDLKKWNETQKKFYRRLKAESEAEWDNIIK